MSTAEHVADIILTQLERVSPSLAEVLRICPLQALLSRAHGADLYVLGNPKAWLGTAYHAVLEHVASEPIGSAGNDPIEEVWGQAVKALGSKMCVHPLNKRFGPPTGWPGYYVALAGMRIRASEICRRPRAVALHKAQGRTACTSVREELFAACGGRLVGRPDLIEGDEVIDYKSGTVYEKSGNEPSVKGGYIRQLRLYGFLVHANLGRWPTKGILLPMLGERVEIELTPQACEDEASAAITLFNSVRAKCESASRPSDLALPSPEACSWCSYKIICSAYWEAVTPAWSLEGRRGDLEGTMLFPSGRAYGGRAYALRFAIERGTIVVGDNVVSPLESSVHEDAGRCIQGDRVRVIGLSIRDNGQLSPTLYTVMKRAADLPDVRFGAL